MQRIRVLWIAALAALSLSPPAWAADKIALVVKSLGNGFFDAARQGAQEAAKELGGLEIVYAGPAKATAEGQVEIVNALIAQNVKAIAISANDPDALVPVLNVALAFKELVSGEWPWGKLALIFGSTCVYAAAALVACVRLFSRESVLFRS